MNLIGLLEVISTEFRYKCKLLLLVNICPSRLHLEPENRPDVCRWITIMVLDSLILY